MYYTRRQGLAESSIGRPQVHVVKPIEELGAELYGVALPVDREIL